MNEKQVSQIEQLKQALNAGAIDRDTYATLAGMIARLDGSGAIAQGPGALALGAEATYVGRDNNSTINYGILIEQGNRPGASRADLRRAYLARILIQANQLPLFAGEGASAQVRLSAVYTALLSQRSEGEPRFTAELSSIGYREPSLSCNRLFYRAIILSPGGDMACCVGHQARPAQRSQKCR